DFDPEIVVEDHPIVFAFGDLADDFAGDIAETWGIPGSSETLEFGELAVHLVETVGIALASICIGREFCDAVSLLVDGIERVLGVTQCRLDVVASLGGCVFLLACGFYG